MLSMESDSNISSKSFVSCPASCCDELFENKDELAEHLYFDTMEDDAHERARENNISNSC